MTATTLHFTRRFTSGHLVGLEHQDKLTFVSRAAAEDWLAKVVAAGESGRLNYKIVTAYTAAA